jgi:murein tripeptide amidase MpaA
MRLIVFSIVVSLSIPGFSQQDKLVSYFEKSGFKETPRYSETYAFSQQLDASSKKITLLNYGTSPQGRELFCLVADKDGLTDPTLIHQKNRVVLFVEACIHAGEPDGKDAGFLLLLDLVNNPDKQTWLDRVTIVFIPIVSPDGHERFGPFNRINQNGPVEMGWRTNAQNLNLNRDFLKAEAPEMQALLAFFNTWEPDFFIDCHVTDGADYIYPITYSMETKGNMNEGQTAWQKEVYLPYVTEKMEKEKCPIFPYVNFRQWFNIESGLSNWATPPALSTGYSAVTNCPGLLIEAHMLKDYKTRVFSTYHMIRFSAEILNREADKIIALNKFADEECVAESFRKKPFSLDFEMTGDSVPVLFKGMEYKFNKSEITGNDYISYSDKQKDYQLWYFEALEVTEMAWLPAAYVVPAEYSHIEKLLQFHKIAYRKTTVDTEVEMDSYRFTNVEFANRPYEGHQRISSFKKDSIRYKKTVHKGSLIIPVSQPKARLIAHIFEPGSPSSLLQYGYFNSVFEQKEYGESYVLEKTASEMIAKDPQLKKAFEEALKENPELANDFYGKLNWFYFHSPYADPWLSVYPIGKIFDNSLLDKLR